MLEFGYCVAAREATAATEILLVPEGAVELVGAQTLTMNASAGKRIIDEWHDRGTDMTIDYEHSSHYQAPQGGKSIAAGWVKSLEYKDGKGLVARVEWTSAAKAHLEEREYRYYSPIFLFDKETREIQGISSVALTNQPRMKNIEALAASSAALLETVNMTKTKEKKADEKKDVGSVRVELGKVLCMEGDAMAGGSVMDLALALSNAGVSVPEGADEGTIIGLALQFVKQNGGAADDGGEDMADEEAASAAEDKTETQTASALLASLGADTEEAAILKVKDMQKQADQVEVLASQVAELTQAATSKKIDAKIEEFVASHKINPNDEEEMKACRDLAEKDFDSFVAVVGARTPYVQSGRVVANTTVKPDNRKSIIESAIREYNENRDRLTGIQPASWVNQSLREKDLELLTASEKDGLN